VQRSIATNNFVDSHIWAELLYIILIVVLEPALLKRGQNDITERLSAWRDGCLDAQSRFPRVVLPASQKHALR
jgi:hypothetical protein